MVKGGQVGLSLRSTYQDLGIPMKIGIPSDSSTANSLTDRLGAGQRTKHFGTRFFWIQERVQDGDLSIKKVLTAKKCADVEAMLQYYNNIASLRGLVSCCKMTETRAPKWTVLSVDREHRDGCAS